MSEVSQERAALLSRISAAFGRYQDRPAMAGDILAYERARANDATAVLCNLIGRLEGVIGSDFIEVTAERVVEAIENAVDHVRAGSAR